MSILGKVVKEYIFGRKSPTVAPDGEPVLKDVVGRQSEGGNILCFAAGSEGDALKQLLFWTVAPLKAQARDIVVLDLRDKHFCPKLAEALGQPVWFAISHFAVGQHILIEINGQNLNLWASHGIPFIRLYGDYPAYYPDRHLRHFRNSINNYFDQYQVEFYRRWFPDQAICSILPPVIYDPMPLDLVDYKAKLSGKIIFPKNGNSPDALRRYWKNILPSSLSESLLAIGEACTAANQINLMPKLDDRILEYFAEHGIDLRADPATICFLAAQLDDYLRRVKSDMIVRALLDLPVIIRGNSWEHINFTGKRASLDPDSDYFRTAPLIDKAPALVDMSPNTQHTPHNRICRAAGRGTAFITNRQEFLNNMFERTERFSFEFTTEGIYSLVEHYVLHPQEAIDLGIEQARAFRAAYPEEHYAARLRSVVQLGQFRVAGRPDGTQNFVAYPSTLL